MIQPLSLYSKDTADFLDAFSNCYGAENLREVKCHKSPVMALVTVQRSPSVGNSPQSSVSYRSWQKLRAAFIALFGFNYVFKGFSLENEPSEWSMLPKSRIDYYIYGDISVSQRDILLHSIPLPGLPF